MRKKDESDEKATETPSTLRGKGAINTEAAKMLTFYRLSAGLSQMELERMVGWKKQHLHRIEKGASEMKLDEFIAVFEVLGLEANDALRKLLTGKWRPTQEPTGKRPSQDRDWRHYRRLKRMGVI